MKPMILKDGMQMGYISKPLEKRNGTDFIEDKESLWSRLLRLLESLTIKKQNP